MSDWLSATKGKQKERQRVANRGREPCACLKAPQNFFRGGNSMADGVMVYAQAVGGADADGKR
jgi:hypothetical protein